MRTTNNASLRVRGNWCEAGGVCACKTTNPAPIINRRPGALAGNTEARRMGDGGGVRVEEGAKYFDFKTAFSDARRFFFVFAEPRRARFTTTAYGSAFFFLFFFYCSLRDFGRSRPRLFPAGASTDTKPCEEKSFPLSPDVKNEKK